MSKKKHTSEFVASYGIRAKLQIGFLAVLLLTLLVGGVGYYGVYKINRGAEDLGGHWLKATVSLARVIEDTEATRRTLLLGYTMRTSVSSLKDLQSQFTNYKTKWEEDFSVYEEYVINPEEKAKNETMRQSFSIYIQDAEEIWRLLEEGKGVEARPKLIEKSMISFEKLLKDMEDQIDIIALGGEQAVADAQATNHSVLSLLIIFVLIALFVGIVLAIILARHISKPLAEVTMVTRSVADGDLGVKIPIIKNKDEIGVLSKAVSEMVHSLREIIGEVLTQSENVAATSQELSASAEEATAASEQVSATLAQLASGAADQAISVKDTSLIIEQLSASAQQVATNTNIVSESSGKAARAADLGAFQVKNAIEKIGQIRDVTTQTAEAVFRFGDQSKQIGQIVDVIKGIADQTNLLALNAAIEAARAGEQGRGFAVVAEEVRKLAEQSSSSAVQIASLVDTIQRETERAVEMMEIGKVEVVSGVEAVNLAGDSFRTIVGEINTVVEQIQMVTTAAQQMVIGNTQAVKSVESVGVIADQTSISAEEISTASEEQASSMVSVSQSAEALAKFGEALMNVVAKFKV